MSDDIPHLFVYGTLMTWASSEYGRAERERLIREATSRGPATMAGRLWDLGLFPGLEDSNDPGDMVHGEVLELASPLHSLAWLDIYEGIRSGPPADNPYERAARTAKLASGEELTAWVYVYRHDLGRARLLPAGCWGPTG